MDSNIFIEKSDKVYGVPTHTSSMVSFDDIEEYKRQKLTFPTAILIKTGDIIDSITLKYGEGMLSRHGGAGGSGQEFALAKDEHIIRIEGSYYPSYVGKATIDSLIIHTSKGRRYGSGRIKSPTRAFDYKIPEGCGLCCLYGTTEQHPCGLVSLSQIGFYHKLLKSIDLKFGKDNNAAMDFLNSKK